MRVTRRRTASRRRRFLIAFWLARRKPVTRAGERFSAKAISRSTYLSELRREITRQIPARKFRKNLLLDASTGALRCACSADMQRRDPLTIHRNLRRALDIAYERMRRQPPAPIAFTGNYGLCLGIIMGAHAH